MLATKGFSFPARYGLGFPCRRPPLPVLLVLVLDARGARFVLSGSKSLSSLRASSESLPSPPPPPPPPPPPFSSSSELSMISIISCGPIFLDDDDDDDDEEEEDDHDEEAEVAWSSVGGGEVVNGDGDGERRRYCDLRWLGGGGEAVPSSPPCRANCLPVNSPSTFTICLPPVRLRPAPPCPPPPRPPPPGGLKVRQV